MCHLMARRSPPTKACPFDTFGIAACASRHGGRPDRSDNLSSPYIRRMFTGAVRWMRSFVPPAAPNTRRAVSRPSTAPFAKKSGNSSVTRSNLDNAGVAGDWAFQLIPPVRAWSDRYRDTAILRDRSTRLGCLHTRRKCLVGLHCDAGPRDHHFDQWPRWPEGYRYLASALLYHNGGMEPRIRRRSDPPSCRRPPLDYAS